MDYLQTEIEVIDHLQHPHLFFIGKPEIKKNVSSEILSDYKDKEILIIDPYGFSTDSVFSGLTEKHIEYIAKNAPQDYKINILKILKDQETMQSVFEIVKSMDTDLGNNSTQNQERIKNVIQYINDNQIAFEF